MRLITWPNPILTAPCAAVEDFDEALRELGGVLSGKLLHYRGLGLAAPQLGVLKRVAAVREASDGAITIVVNPCILEHGAEEVQESEGCLSIPGVRLLIRRWRVVTVRFHTLVGEQRTRTFRGLGARVVQHETDHLDGITIYQRAELQGRRAA